MPRRIALAAIWTFGLAGLLTAAPAKPPDATVKPFPTAEDVELAKADDDGWISLFDGKDLKGWYGDPAVWSARDGQIVGKADKVAQNTFLIFNHPFKNF